MHQWLLAMVCKLSVIILFKVFVSFLAPAVSTSATTYGVSSNSSFTQSKSQSFDPFADLGNLGATLSGNVKQSLSLRLSINYAVSYI